MFKRLEHKSQIQQMEEHTRDGTMGLEGRAAWFHDLADLGESTPSSSPCFSSRTSSSPPAGRPRRQAGQQAGLSGPSSARRREGRGGRRGGGGRIRLGGGGRADLPSWWYRVRPKLGPTKQLRTRTPLRVRLLRLADLVGFILCLGLIVGLA
jgi:hypothetical protein